MFPMESWLAELTLPDGFRPFDGSYAEAMAKKLAASGVAGVPTDRAAVRQLFGVGWWKYDTAEAAKLLQSQGFKKDGAGKWQLPDGKPWQVTINAPNNFEVQSMRLAFAVADSWKKFGIDVTVKQLESAPFNAAFANGEYEADVHWPGCGVMPDVYTNMDLNWHQRLVVANGTPAAGNNSRFKNEKASAILDELSKLPDKHARVVPLTTDFFKLMVAEAAWLPMFGTSKFVPITTQYWTGLPTAENPYEGPWWWWTGMRYYLTKVKPTGNR
jgi:peptide/nickel transport system substrate-binding protein